MKKRDRIDYDQPTPVRKYDIRKQIESKIFYSPDGCWYWTGAIIKHKKTGLVTAVVTIKNIKCVAYRIMYELTYGDFDKSLCVCHTCDNRLCMNPNHFFLGTKGDNNRDARRKGRSRGREAQTHCKRGHLLSPENLYNITQKARRCKICGLELNKASVKRRKLNLYDTETPL